MTRKTTDETGFSYTLLPTDRQVSRFCKVFACNSSTNTNLSKTCIFKIIQLGGFLGILLGPLIKVGLH